MICEDGTETDNIEDCLDPSERLARFLLSGRPGPSAVAAILDAMSDGDVAVLKRAMDRVELIEELGDWLDEYRD